MSKLLVMLVILLGAGLAACSGNGGTSAPASASGGQSCDRNDYYFAASPYSKGYPHAVPVCR
jgi:hypothetical protein